MRNRRGTVELGEMGGDDEGELLTSYAIDCSLSSLYTNFVCCPTTSTKQILCLFVKCSINTT
jgi:hypothetical protein